MAPKTRSLNIRCYFYLGDRSHRECPGGESKKGNRQRWYKGSHLWTRNKHSHCGLAMVKLVGKHVNESLVWEEESQSFS